MCIIYIRACNFVIAPHTGGKNDSCKWKARYSRGAAKTDEPREWVVRETLRLNPEEIREINVELCYGEKSYAEETRKR